MTCYPILLHKMVEMGTTYRELATVADINTVTLYLKMVGIKRWKLAEAVKICCFFRTSETEHLFYKKFCLVCTKTL